MDVAVLAKGGVKAGSLDEASELFAKVASRLAEAGAEAIAINGVRLTSLGVDDFGQVGDVDGHSQVPFEVDLRSYRAGTVAVAMGIAAPASAQIDQGDIVFTPTRVARRPRPAGASRPA